MNRSNATSSNRRAGIRVLVVDDTHAIREYTAETLRHMQVGEVDTAGSAIAALKRINVPGADFNLMICDLGMPEFDGLMLIRALAGLPKPPALIVSSGYKGGQATTAMQFARHLGLQVLGHIARPFEAGVLSRILDLYQTPQLVTADAQYSCADVSEAIATGGLSVAFQPKVSLRDGTPQSCEALARLQTINGTAMSPTSFIPAIEAANGIDRFTDRIISMARDQKYIWSKAGLNLGIAVNLSALSLNDPALPARISSLAQGNQDFAEKLTVELTEGHISDEPTHMEAFSHMHERGIRISIDDFGTGHSTLARVQKYPFTEIKVDSRFVHGAADNADRRAILESSAALGHRLNMKVVAEGVENWDDWHAAREAGCDMAQGFLISKAVSAGEMAGSLRNWSKKYEQAPGLPMYQTLPSHAPMSAAAG